MPITNTALVPFRPASPAVLGSPAPPPLVLPDGRPLRPAGLTWEVARAQLGTVRSTRSGHPAQNLTGPRLARLLMAAEQGDALAYLELAEEMEEKDLHYLSVLGTRKRGVAQLPIEVIAGGETPEYQRDADLVKAWLERDVLEEELQDILDAVGKGYSATEVCWRRTSTSWLPAALKWRDPRWFEFDRVDGETLRLSELGGPVPLEPAKFIVHVHKAKSGLPMRGGLARAVAWGYMFKNFAIKDWLAFLETYGMPLRVGRYDNGETEANIEILMRAVTGVGVDAAAVFPKTMDMQFIDGASGSGPAELWQSMATYIDDQVSKAVLGQTNTTDAKAGGLGSGQADVHNTVREDIARADAKLLAATLNRDLIVPMVLLNHGPRDRYPRLKIGKPDEEDVAAMVTAAKELVPLGLRVGARQLRERVGLPEPEADEEVLSGGPAQMPPGGASDLPAGAGGAGMRPSGFLGPLKGPSGAGATAAATALAGDPDRIDADADPIDVAAGEALDDWEPVIAPVLDPVRAAVASAADLADLRARLTAAIDGMDAGALTELLTSATFAARLSGEAAVEDEAAAGGEATR